MTQAADKTSILIVDDDENKLLTLETVLAELGQDVVCARSGREALRKLLHQSFALILLDVHMPGMDGFETASLIRQRQMSESTPIIFITAYGDDLFMERGYSLGAVDYILTPIIPEVLRGKVSVFVELYQRTEQIRRQKRRLQQRATQLSALANQLTEAEHGERRRLAGVLHDHLQQLLVAAKMRLRLASPLTEDDALRRNLQAIDELLDESISASRSLTVELSPPILHDGGLEKALEWLARKFQKDHALTVHLDADRDEPNLPDHLLNFLYQSVREFLFNVVKHAGVNEAWLRVEHADEMLRVTVEDRGAGCRDSPLDQRPGVDHFGLFSIRERLLFLDGRLEIETAEGEGTRITVSVPVTPEPDEPAAAAPAVEDAATPDAEPRQGVIRVLLVDDHQMLRKGLTSLLAAHADVDVIGEAADGEEAVRRALKLKPDVVVMDLTMPKMGGIEATRRIVGELPDVRVIGLSMHDSPEMARAMVEAGAVTYLNKDGPPDQLLAAIRAACALVPEAQPAGAEARADR